LSTHEREITQPVSLCTPGGRLDPRAIGFTRTPLHHANLRGWGRSKRWEYWAIVTPTHVLAVTLASLDYVGLVSLFVLDRARSTERSQDGLAPLARGIVLPDRSGVGRASGRAGGVSITLEEEPAGTRIRCDARGVSIDVLALRPAGHESLGVVVPWSRRLFQYTVQDVGRPAQGRAPFEGRSIEIDPQSSFAVLDHGRGRWPYRNTWNWAAGHDAARDVSLQLGGKWTDGTGSTENGLFVQGRLHKIGETVRWHYDRKRFLAAWRIEGERLAVTMRPFHDRHARVPLGVISFDVHQCFGTFEGWVLDDSGSRVSVDGLVGWAEEANNRW